MKRLLVWIVAAKVLVCAGLAAQLPKGEPGIVIVEPGPVSELTAGASYDTWSVSSPGGVKGGVISDPFVFHDVLETAAQLGELTLLTTSLDEPVSSKTVPRLVHSIVTRPRLRPELAERYERAWDNRRAEPSESSELLASIASDLERAGRLEAAAWITMQAMALVDEESELAELSQSGLAMLSSDVERGRWLRMLSLVDSRQGRRERSLERLEQAAELYRSSGAHELLYAQTLRSIAEVQFALNRHDDATGTAHEAIAMLERLAPESGLLVIVLSNLGNGPLFTTGQLAEARLAQERATELTRRLVPGSRSEVIQWANLARVDWQAGELAEAERLYGRGMRLAEELDDREMISTIAGNIGLIAHDRGDLATAEGHFLRALHFEEEQAVGSLGAAHALNNLGMVANERSRYEEADAHYERALAIYRERVPASVAVARTLNNRANNARKAGDLDRAQSLVRESLAITGKIAPESQTHTMGLVNLASVLEELGDLDGSRTVYVESVATARARAPGSLRVAKPLQRLGRVERLLGRLEAARAAQSEALAVVEVVAPGSALEVEILYELGLIAQLGDQVSMARELMCRAASSLDQFKLGMGGDRAAGNPFAETLVGVHRSCFAELVAAGQLDEAWNVLERSRSRDLLTLLSTRDMTLDAALPEDLATRRRDLNQRYSSATSELLGLTDDQQSTERQLARRRLEDLRRERALLDAEVRIASPRVGALTQPEIVTWRQVAAGLEPGTVMLSYSLGSESSHVMLVSSDGPSLKAIELDVGRDALVDLVAGLRSAIATRSMNWEEPARALYDVLLDPIDAELAQARGVLISPEGPLHVLPFAALVDAEGRVLVDRLLVHTVGSATLFAELGRARDGSPPTHQLVAFADPVKASGSPRVSSVSARPMNNNAPGMPLARFLKTELPGTRREVEAIARLFPDGTEVFLGAAASEERFKRIAGSARVVHVATHGYLDSAVPLDSGIVLAHESASENGLLQAWEIFEQVRLDADLVVLSACETALGGEVPGEGWIGLTRALQYAGARSIVATLWQVPDASTSTLMERFYRELASGQHLGESLRRAQLSARSTDFELSSGGELLHGDETQESRAERAIGGVAPTARGVAAHPYYWAAFQLIGPSR